MQLTRSLLRLAAAFVLCTFSYSAQGADAVAPAPDLEQRVADLEAFVMNLAPGGTVDALDAQGKPLLDADGAPQQVERASNVAGVPGPGQNAWLMVCSALVLFMTLPGLALFYGGLVRTKNVLSVMAQCMGIAGLVTILWWAVGYSLVFGSSFDGTFLGPILGGTEYFFLRGVGQAPNTGYAAWASHITWSMYQLMFAIITPALIVGAIAERMKYSRSCFSSRCGCSSSISRCPHDLGGTGLMNACGTPPPASRRSTSRAAQSSTCPPAGRRWCSA
jgi:Amt family ammonium transporter